MVAPALLALALGTLGVIAALPEGPHVSLSASDPKVGRPFNVTCSVVGHDVLPANFTITANTRTWPVTLSHDGRQATAVVTTRREGSVQLGCAVHVGGVEVRTNTTVQAYYLPVPLLNVTNTTVAGAELRGECSLPAGTARDIQVQVLAGGRVLEELKQPPVAFRLRVREEDAERGLELICMAKMDPFSPRNKSQRIHVLIKPRLDIESCPLQQNWTEGQEGILHCRAKGTPEPQVRCSKDGNSLIPGTAHLADRTHNGTYLCQATNALGTAERHVTVWVHYNDSFQLLPVVLGVLLTALALLVLAGFFLYRHSTKFGEYWLWKRQPPPGVRPLQPPGSSQAAAAAPNGCATP